MYFSSANLCLQYIPRSSLVSVFWTVTLLVSACRQCSAQLSHSCQRESDCSSIGNRWRAYKFVCCTTVACSDPFRYFLVNSGCTTTNACKHVARITDSMFAARVRAEDWLKNENLLYRDCKATRSNLALLTEKLSGKGPAVDPDVPKAVARREPANGQAVTSFVAVAAAVRDEPRRKKDTNPWRTRGSCSRIESACQANRKTCCVHIRCNSQHTQTGGLRPEYIVQELCSNRCKISTSRSGSSYLFTFPPDEWERRSWYEDDYKTGPLTSSCTETRYFYSELKFKLKEQKNNTIAHTGRVFTRSRTNRKRIV